MLGKLVLKMMYQNGFDENLAVVQETFVGSMLVKNIVSDVRWGWSKFVDMVFVANFECLVG